MNRGTLTIEVLHGLPEVLACPELRDADVLRGDGPWAHHPDTQQSGSQVQSGRLEIHDVTGNTQIAEVLARAPGAVWQAWCDERTEAPNLWIAFHPAAGVVEGSWLDDEVVVPAGWVTTASFTPQAQRWLTRYRIITGLLEDPTSMHTRQVRLTWNAGFGRELTDADLAEYAARGSDPHAQASYRLAGLPADPRAACEALFEATNLAQGPLWEQLSCQGLGRGRGHTSLSVGDEVGIDGRTWRCAPVGWTDTGPTRTPGVAADPLARHAGEPVAGPDTGPQVTR